MSTISCKFKFTCPKQWSELGETATAGVRFCSSCNSDVYLATTSSDFERYAREEKCVALIKGRMMTLGMPDWETYVEPYVLIVPQEYSAKQLYLLKRLLYLDGSVEDARKRFFMKEVKLEGLGDERALAMDASLRELGIESTVRGEVFKRPDKRE